MIISIGNDAIALSGHTRKRERGGQKRKQETHRDTHSQKESGEVVVRQDEGVVEDQQTTKVSVRCC